MTKKSNQTYKQLRSELDDILVWFEQDDIDIDTAIKHYEEAIKVADDIKKYLDNAKNTITKLQSQLT